MVSFSQLVKYLNINKGRKTTTAENVDTRREKYDHIVPTWRVTKIPKKIVLAAHTDINWNGKHGIIFCQYNFEFDTAFRLVNINRLRGENINIDTGVGTYLESSFLCIKWRIDNEVTRYFLFGNPILQNTITNQFVITPPVYNGELIPPICVFEVWTGLQTFPYDGAQGLLADIELETNFLQDPSDINEREILYEGAALQTRDDIVHPTAEGPFTDGNTVQEQGMINQAYESN